MSVAPLEITPWDHVDRIWNGAPGGVSGYLPADTPSGYKGIYTHEMQDDWWMLDERTGREVRTWATVVKFKDSGRYFVWSTAYKKRPALGG